MDKKLVREHLMFIVGREANTHPAFMLFAGYIHKFLYTFTIGSARKFSLGSPGMQNVMIKAMPSV